MEKKLSVEKYQEKCVILCYIKKMSLLIENNTSIEGLKMSQSRFKEIADIYNWNKKQRRNQKKHDLDRISNFIPEFLVEKFKDLR